MNWLGGPWLQDCCTQQISSVQYYCTSLPVQTRVLLIHSTLPLLLSTSSSSAVEASVSAGMWGSWDDASVCSQVLALKQCKTPQFMQTVGCKVALVLLSHFERLVHAGPHTATPLLSVAPEPVGISFSHATPGIAAGQLCILSWSSVQGIL